MLYFAYGSNMSLARLRHRVPSARRLSVGALSGHRLCFHKVSHRDGSAKCDALETGLSQDRVWGVVYRIAPEERVLLDQAEGLGQGYQRAWVDLSLQSGEDCRAFLYRATLIDQRLAPFTWYKQHVLVGARENGLPEDYVRLIEAVYALQDADRERHRNETRIHHALAHDLDD
ncbi:MAG: gamma-glutamylcyclotransferase [Candidatus Thiodiazotropha sp.]|jgi:gamma-glutamylcyclotransferase